MKFTTKRIEHYSRDEILREKAWYFRQRAYQVLSHGISLALDAGIMQSKCHADAEDYADRMTRSLIREAAVYNNLELQS